MIKKLFVDEEGQLHSPVRWGLIVLAVLCLSYYGYRIWTRDSHSNSVAMMCMTPGCGYQRTQALQVGEIIPLECPKCGKKSVVPSFKCKYCGAPNIWNENRGLKPPTKCTKCGKENYHGK